MVGLLVVWLFDWWQRYGETNVTLDFGDVQVLPYFYRM